MSSDIDVDIPCDMCKKRSCYGCKYEQEPWDEDDFYETLEDYDLGSCND